MLSLFNVTISNKVITYYGGKSYEETDYCNFYDVNFGFW